MRWPGSTASRLARGRKTAPAPDGYLAPGPLTARAVRRTRRLGRYGLGCVGCCRAFMARPAGLEREEMLMKARRAEMAVQVDE